MTSSFPSPHDVVGFWRDAGPGRWFKKDVAFDAEFKGRFEPAHHAAATGALDTWSEDAEGALALLILLDQLPRNAWRGSGHMFATDGKALAVAHAAIDAGFDRQVDETLRAFFYMPFMHSESLLDQTRCVELCVDLADNLRSPSCIGTSSSVSAAFPIATRRWDVGPHRKNSAFWTKAVSPASERIQSSNGFSGTAGSGLSGAACRSEPNLCAYTQVNSAPSRKIWAE